MFYREFSALSAELSVGRPEPLLTVRRADFRIGTLAERPAKDNVNSHAI